MTEFSCLGYKIDGEGTRTNPKNEATTCEVLHPANNIATAGEQGLLGRNCTPQIVIKGAVGEKLEDLFRVRMKAM